MSEKYVLMLGLCWVLGLCVLRVNSMTKETQHGVRAAYILIGTGCLAELLAVVCKVPTDTWNSLVLFGFIWLEFSSRRALPKRCNCHSEEEVHHDHTVQFHT